MLDTVARTAFVRPADRSDELGGRPGVVRFLDLPVRRIVRIAGSGRPGPDAFTPRLPGLYGTAYALHFALKGRGIAGKVGPLEGLWWTVDGTSDLDAVFGAGEREDWRWSIFIALPDEATDDELETAIQSGRAKLLEPFAASLEVGVLDEGRVAQVLHLGPYAEERPSIERLHEAIRAAGLEPRGRHHEIYLGDPRRSSPARLRTIIRQAVT